MTRHWSRLAYGVLAAAPFVLGCRRDDLAEPSGIGRPPDRPGAILVEVTFRNIGSPRMTSSVIVASSVAELEALHAERSPAGAVHDLTVPTTSTGGGNATIQLDSLSVSSFTQNGVRYFSASYRVRNAQKTDSAAFDTPRRNLTFLPVSTSSTLLDTPVHVFENDDGTPADPTVARQLVPMGLVASGGGATLTSLSPDVLQVLTEAEASAIAAPTGVTNRFPYGFVVRRSGSSTTRTLDPSPGPNQFDGVVTFAYQLPVAPAPNVSTITVMMLGLDDSDTRLTQSREEAGASATTTAEARGRSLGATGLTLLPKVEAFLGGGQERAVCAVRTAGASGSPTGAMFPAPNAEPWLVPSPYRVGPYFVPRTAQLAAARCPSVGAVGPTVFTVHGMQHGRPSGGYLGAGTSLAHAPALSGTGFFAGEPIEVTLTTAFGGSAPIVARYRASTLASLATFTEPFAAPNIGQLPPAVVAADLNGDGRIDLVSGQTTSDKVRVLMNNGDGTYTVTQYTGGRGIEAIAVGDFDGDGDIDIAAASDFLTSDIRMFLNDGNGVFASGATLNASGDPSSLSAADLDGDGDLDLVAGFNGGKVQAFLNNGSATFTAGSSVSTGATQAGPYSLVTDDLDNDGDIDVVFSQLASKMFIIKNNGAGGLSIATTITLASRSMSVAAGDFNGDGFVDIASGLRDNNTVAVFLNDGAGNFSAIPSQVIASAPGVRTLVVADFNGDGRLDLAGAGANSSSIEVWLANETGTLVSHAVIPIGALPGDVLSGVAAADMNNDGKIDLVIAELNGPIHTWLNQ